MKKYDVVIVGAGAAGLQLLWRLLDSASLADWKILVVDVAAAISVPKTRSWWAEEVSPRPEISRAWSRISVLGIDEKFSSSIAPMQYFSVDSGKLRELVRGRALASGRVDWVDAAVSRIRPSETGVFVEVGEEVFFGSWVFDSVAEKIQEKSGEVFLWQNFLGRKIRVDAVHKISEPILMDFGVEQLGAVAFFYVLPLGSREILVEYTEFSSGCGPDEETFRQKISRFLEQKKIFGESLGEESGAIPMTTQKFPQGSGRVVKIWVAAGRGKSSSGYSFRRGWDRAGKIVACLESGRVPRVAARGNFWFSFLDGVLLWVLWRRPGRGAAIFSQLFACVPMETVLKFLDEKVGFWGSLAVVLRLPIWFFVRGACGFLVFRGRGWRKKLRRKI